MRLKLFYVFPGCKKILFSHGRFTAFRLPPTINLFLPSFQPTATIRLKLAVKDREDRVNPPAPTLLAPPVRAPTGETMLLHPTNPLSGAPWIHPLLLGLTRPPPRVLAALETLQAHLRWIPVWDGRCSPSLHEIAQSPDTSTPSGESRVGRPPKCTCIADVHICDSFSCAMHGKQRQAFTLTYSH